MGSFYQHSMATSYNIYPLFASLVTNVAVPIRDYMGSVGVTTRILGWYEALHVGTACGGSGVVPIQNITFIPKMFFLLILWSFFCLNFFLLLFIIKVTTKCN